MSIPFFWGAMIGAEHWTVSSAKSVVDDSLWKGKEPSPFDNSERLILTRNDLNDMQFWKRYWRSQSHEFNPSHTLALLDWVAFAL